MNNKIREFESNIYALKQEGENLEDMEISYGTDKNSSFFNSLLEENERRIKIWGNKIKDLKNKS